MSTLKIKRENGKIFCPLADSWHIETPEEKVRQEYIKILVENPLHLVGGFELFRDTFLFGVFFYQPRKEGLCFFLYIGEVGM